MSILIVTGMSGAGKSIVVDALEDLGYFCVDNLPSKLIMTFATLIQKATDDYQKVAVVTDIRSGRHFDMLPESLNCLKDSGFDYKLFYIDADDQTLIRRYKETRRSHPLVNENGGSLSKSISTERIRLNYIKGIADYYLDTSRLSPADCKHRVFQMLADAPNAALKVHFTSFGFKYGTPSDCDLMFDVRCLPNPFYIPELKESTGLEDKVKDYVFKFDEAQQLLAKFKDLIDTLLPLYVKEGKSQLVVAFGCTGGKHRSVCFAQALMEHLSGGDYSVTIAHRDINK